MSITIADLRPKLAEIAAGFEIERDGILTKEELDAASAKVDTFTTKARSAIEELRALMRDGAGAASDGSPSKTPDVVSLRTPACDFSERLNVTQRAVVGDVDNKAAERSAAARTQLVEKAQRLGYSEAQLDEALTFIRDSAPVCVGFNPDKSLRVRTRSYGSGEEVKPEYKVLVEREKSTVIDAFLVDAGYRSQFETGLTSGSPTAYPGGSRDKWEKTIFEDGYHAHDLIPGERPKYGYLAVGSNRVDNYGTCKMVLKPGVRKRATVTPKDSSQCSAGDVGTVEHFQHVLNKIDDSRFRSVMAQALGNETPRLSSWGYTEAQIHGPINFDEDIAQVIGAAKYKGTPYEAKLREFCGKHGIELVWDENGAITPDAGSDAGVDTRSDAG